MRLLKKIFIISIISTNIISCSHSNSCTDVSNNQSLLHPKDILRRGGGSEIPNLDPQFCGDTVSSPVIYDLFEPILDIDQQNKPIAGAATSWEASDDKKHYVFHLRKDMYFSDGTPINANDYVYTWQRIVDPNLGSDRGSDLNSVLNAKAIMHGKMDKTKLGVYAPDPYTFVVDLSYPDPTILYAAASPELGVVSRKNIEKYGAYWTKPQNLVTSGAYTLKEHIVNGKLVLAKNSKYYAKNNVHISTVEYYPISDQNSELAQYKSGALDMTFTFPVDQYKSLKTEFSKEFHLMPQAAEYHYEFNLRNKVLQDVRIRQALSMAIDREVLANNVMGQGQIPLYSLAISNINNGAFADVKYDWSSWPRDQQIAEAKKLYKEAGYSATNPLNVTVAYNTADNHKKIAIAVASMWKSILGVNVTLNNSDWKVFLQNRRKGNFQIGRMGGVATADDITNFTDSFRCNDVANMVAYCNPKFDELFTQASQISDDNQRQALQKQGLSILNNDYAIIPMYQYVYGRLIKSYVKGYDPSHNLFDQVKSKWIYIQ